jgi:hypothetical protein
MARMRTHAASVTEALKMAPLKPAPLLVRSADIWRTRYYRTGGD